jgi:formate-dependent nitrite reductase cytochrome c552 subunit
MKRFANISRVLLIGCCLAFLSMQTFGQVVKMKVVAMTPGKLGSIGKSSALATTGLKVVGKGSKAFLLADTTGSGATVASSFTWSFVSRPTASNAAFDSAANNQYQSFTADSGGQYIVSVSITGGATDQDTFWVSTYIGSPTTAVSGAIPCATCHSTNNTGWQTTGHAQIYKQGIMGQLEVNAYGQGEYSTSCWQCHTTGYNVSANNGNFGYLAHSLGWDTTAFKGLPKAGSFSLIPNGDSAIYKNMVTNYVPLVSLSTIGCESCHGPGKDHNGDISKIGLSLDAGVCQSCHDAPPRHVSGTYWALSDHATMPLAGKDATSASCFPCHSGSAFVKWVTDGKPATDANWSAASDASYPITCAVCHDPHSTANPNQLRTATVDTLRNGYVIPTGAGGLGQLCMNCHRSRYAVSAKVTTKAPYYGFASHYGPHGNPQADMLMGQNAYQYGDSSLTGLATHAGVPDACVTCHMPGGDHSLTMQDTAGTGVMHDRVDACKTCHGPQIQKFDDIKASYDYDHNGKIEGVQTEIAGMLAQLKARLPLDSTGAPITGLGDSLKVKNRPDLVQNLYTYFFVTNDGSGGMHNAKYAVALLQKALGFYPTGVKVVNQNTPTTFAVSQNYPNPFNPTTNIEFSIPNSARIQLNVYNILGELVKTLTNGDIVSGNYRVTWNGTNNNGTSVASGIYFYRLVAESKGAANYVITKKMLLMK